jgi:hypothetical protein
MTAHHSPVPGQTETNNVSCAATHHVGQQLNRKVLSIHCLPTWWLGWSQALLGQAPQVLILPLQEQA